MRRLEPRRLAFREERVGMTESGLALIDLLTRICKGKKEDEKGRKSVGAEENKTLELLLLGNMMLKGGGR